MPESKASKLRALMAAERWQEALRLAATFQDLGPQRAAILSAHSAYTNPRFMLQLGKDLDALKAAGRAALVARYVACAGK